MCAALSRRLRRKVESLRELESTLHFGRDRFWAQKFLHEVYQFVEGLSDRDLQQLAGADGDEPSDVFRRVLHLTTKADAKTRSRWARALFFIHDEIETDGGSVQQKLKEFGGISGCARADATPRSSRRVKLRDWV